MNQSTTNISKSFILINALLASITPLATDTYLAAFTSMSIYFSTPINMIEITLSVFLFGYGIGQLFGGPLADRHGRKLFILSGIFIFALSSFAIVFITEIEYFWALRVLQAFGSGFIAVNSLAMIRDLYSGKEAGKIMSIVTMVMLLAPILAPIIGTTIINFATWHYIFVFLGVYTLIGAYFVIKISETSKKSRDNKVLKNYKKILSEKTPMLIMAAGSLSFAGLFVFITKSSFMYMEFFQLTPNQFTAIYGTTVFMSVIFGALNMNLLKKYSLFQLLFLGVSLQLGISILLLLFYSSHNFYIISLLIMLFISSLGFIFANAFALILENFPTLSGTASALIGVINSLVASIMAFIVSYFHNGTLLPIFIVLTLVTFGSFFIIAINKKEIEKLSH